MRFTGSACRVIIEGRSFGKSIGIWFERLAGGRARLLDILAVRSPAAAGPFTKPGDQRVLLHRAASLIREQMLDALRGEPEIFRAAEVHRQEMVWKFCNESPNS